MKAIRIYEFGGSDALKCEEIPRPEPGANEVLIKVHASSLNPVDIGISAGYLKNKVDFDLPITLGNDVSGVVKQIGEDVKNVNVGDKVYGQASLISGASGAFAEYAKTPAGYIARMPTNLSFAEAAASVLAGVSAYQAIYDLIKLKPGQKILIHGGSGGIGSFAIQIAKYVGAYVATTATGEGTNYVKKLGADKVIDYKKEAFEKLLSDFDAVYDNVGGETCRKSYSVLKRGGIIVSMRDQPDRELMKEHSVLAQFELTNTKTATLNRLAKLFEEGALFVHLEKTYSLEHIKDAFDEKATEQIKGKIAIEMA